MSRNPLTLAKFKPGLTGQRPGQKKCGGLSLRDVLKNSCINICEYLSSRTCPITHPKYLRSPISRRCCILWQANKNWPNVLRQSFINCSSLEGGNRITWSYPQNVELNCANREIHGMSKLASGWLTEAVLVTSGFFVKTLMNDVEMTSEKNLQTKTVCTQTGSLCSFVKICWLLAISSYILKDWFHAKLRGCSFNFPLLTFHSIPNVSCRCMLFIT